MSREYSSAARRAAGPKMPALDDAGLLAWVDRHTDRARQALKALDDLPAPTGSADDVAAEQAARRRLREQLLDVFPSFTVDGATFWAMGELQVLDLCELTKLARVGTQTTDPAGLAALAEFFEGALGAAEYQRFRVHTRTACTHPDLLDDIMEGLVEDLTERPTQPPSHSADGRSTTGAGSRVVSLSRRTVGHLPDPNQGPGPMSAQQFADWHTQHAPNTGPIDPGVRSQLGLADQGPPARQSISYG